MGQLRRDGALASPQRTQLGARATTSRRQRVVAVAAVAVLLATLTATTPANAALEGPDSGDEPGRSSATTPDAPTTTGPIRLAAGDSHTCGIHPDGTVACWGSNAINAPLDDDPNEVELVGQSQAPAGTFTQLEAGARTTCGLRTDQTVSCWGWLEGDRAGQFTQVAAANRNACALDTAGAVTCWGWDTFYYGSFENLGPYTQIGISLERICGLLGDGSLECTSENILQAVPAGTFTSLSVGEGGHNCAIATDQTVACWGHNAHGQTDAPAGTFLEVSAGGAHSCGVRTDQTLVCWGNNGDGRADAPAGTFTTVSAGATHSCGARTDGTVACWGSDEHLGTPVGKVRVPTGTYTAFAATAQQRCGLLGDGTVECWNLDDPGPGPTVAGTFTALDGNGAQMCGLRDDDAIVCWDTTGTPTSPLAGTYQSFAVSWAHGCAVATDQTVGCWGGLGFDEELAPAGTFTQVAVDQGISCGLATDGTAVCWGNEDFGQTDTPTGTFTHLAAGEETACGVRPGGAIECWGAPTPVPAGSFTQIAMTFDLLCGIDTDQHLACAGQGWWAGEEQPPPGEFTQITGDSPPCALRTDGAHQCWGDRHVVWGAPFMAAAAGPASISGTVTGPGGPVNGVVVAAYGPGDTWVGSHTTTTGVDGTYELADVPSDTYRILFSPPAGSSLLQQWFAGSATRAGATPVTTTGTDLPGIDATLDEGATIAGTVTGPGGPVDGAVVWAFGPDDTWAGSYSTTTGSDGTYLLEGVTADTYDVRFSGPAGSDLVAQWYDGAARRADAAPVTTTSGATVTGVDATLEAGATISGTVTGPGGPLEGARVWAYADTDGWVGSGFAVTDTLGDYEINHLAAGTYTVVVVPPSGSGLSNLWYPDSPTRTLATLFVLTPPATASGIDLTYPDPAL